MQTLEQNLNDLQAKIKATEKQYSRIKDSVKLLAVSKKHSISKILALYDAGQRDFGESYCQEALKKIHLIQKKDINWHFIGPIQSNKAQDIAETFTWVHSLSRLKIAVYSLISKH